MVNLLSSGSSKYYVERLLGQGSYGRVVKCTRMTDMKTVAIKMLKNDECHKRAADLEVSALMKLRSLDPDNCNIVRLYNVFNDKEHVCLEFEHLDKSLKGFMRDRNFQPLSLKEIRPIVQQLSTALYHLKTVGLIHADLKLENVMLVNHVLEPYRVKLIDFGLARETSDAKVCSYIQSRPYRSPEIILGLPFSEAIDMWSLGCMTASMYLGTALYPGDSEYDMIRYMVETQGPIPDNLLHRGRRTRHFYQRNDQSTTSHWNLKTPEQYQQEKGIQALENRMVKVTSLDDLLHIRPTNDGMPVDNAAEEEDLLMFVDMIKGMLQFDAAKRITPRQVLMHPFVTMERMSSIYSHVHSCFQLMSVCQRPLTPNNTETVGGSLQQPFHRTAQPFQPVCPQPPPPSCPPCPPSCPPRPPPPLRPCPRSRPPPPHPPLHPCPRSHRRPSPPPPPLHPPSRPPPPLHPCPPSHRHPPPPSPPLRPPSPPPLHHPSPPLLPSSPPPPPPSPPPPPLLPSSPPPAPLHPCPLSHPPPPPQLLYCPSPHHPPFHPPSPPPPPILPSYPPPPLHSPSSPLPLRPPSLPPPPLCPCPHSCPPSPPPPSLRPPSPPSPPRLCPLPPAERSSQSQLRLEKWAVDEDVNKTGTSKTYQKWWRHDTEKAMKPYRPTAIESSRNIQDSIAVRQGIKRNVDDNDVRQSSDSNKCKRSREEERESSTGPPNLYWSSLTQSFVASKNHRGWPVWATGPPESLHHSTPPSNSSKTKSQAHFRRR